LGLVQITRRVKVFERNVDLDTIIKIHLGLVGITRREKFQEKWWFAYNVTKLKPKHAHKHAHTSKYTCVEDGGGTQFWSKDFMFVRGPSVHYQTHKPTLSLHLFIPHLLIQPISSKFPLKQIKSQPHFLLKHFFSNSQFIVTTNTELQQTIGTLVQASLITLY
jgi:hypothetical protein